MAHANPIGMSSGAAPSLHPEGSKSSACASNQAESETQMTVPSLFSLRAAEAPNAIAARGADQQLTFHELEIRSNQLSKYLQSLGVGPEVAVGICLKRSPDFVLSSLAVLKAGGAYVPLDRSYPRDRLAFMLRDCNAQVVITRGCMVQPLSGETWQMIDLDAELPTGSGLSPEPGVAPSPHSLAYVIYTSGSTGTPKGVQITHANLGNLVEWHRRTFEIGRADRTTQLASPGFDAAVWELWPNLCAGAGVYIPDEETRTSPSSLRDWLIANGITVSFVPTPLAEQMLALDWPVIGSLRLLLTGGDALHRYPRPELPFVVVNNYGPTECTVVATSGVVQPMPHEVVPPDIGCAIANTHLVVVDEDLHPVPAGKPGELLIGGANVGRGYCNRPDLTATRFIPDFTTSVRGARLYRTGDLVRFLPDGRVAFLGRIDEQIKIRGYRIEPNEIVSILNQHSGVSQSVVVARHDIAGEKRLLAYIAADSGAGLFDSDLRQHLKSKLPDFMIPSSFIRLDHLPLTPNQKVDHSALPAPDEKNTIRDDDQPNGEASTIIEHQLAVILSELLGVAHVQAMDNFFLLGGHSLLGARLIARIRDSFGVELSLRTLFGNPTVADLAAQIEQLIIGKLQTFTNEELRALAPET